MNARLVLVVTLHREQHGSCAECHDPFATPLHLVDSGGVVMLACGACIDRLDQRAALRLERDAIDHAVARLRERIVARYGWSPGVGYLRRRVRLAREAGAR